MSFQFIRFLASLGQPERLESYQVNEKSACVADSPISRLASSDGSQVLAKRVQQGGGPAGTAVVAKRSARTDPPEAHPASLLP